MKDLYDSVFAHLASKISDRINDINDDKDAAIEALEKEKEAAEAAYQAEIDAINKAIKARERELDIQQKQYNLNRLMSQRTILLYSEKKGMHYVQDTSELRQAKDDLDKAKAEKRISELEEMIEKSNAYYDNLIDQTEQYYDTMIELLEDQKSKFEDLQDLLDEAQMQGLLKELGINEEALLSGSTEEFNKLRDAYVGILADLNSGNQNVLSALSELSGMGTLPSYLGETSNAISDLANNAASLNENLSGVDTSNVNANLGNTAQASSDAAEKVQGVTNALNDLTNDVSNYTIPTINADNFMSSFSEDGAILTGLRGFVDRLKEICGTIPEIWDSTLAETFGEGGGSGDPLAGGLPEDTKYSSLFEPMLSALDVCKSTMEDKLQECMVAWHNFQADLSQVIGTGEGSGDSTGLGGAPSKEGGKGGGEKGSGDKKEDSANADSIVGAIQEGGALIEEALNGEEGWAASFGTAQETIHGYATGIVDCIESMVEQIIDACIEAIKAINMTEKAAGGSGNHKLPAKYSRKGHSDISFEGEAHFAGSSGLKKDEKNALLSEYGQQEMTVYPDGRYRITTEPTMADLPKGTVIYNEKQTKEILENKKDASSQYKPLVPDSIIKFAGKEMTFAEVEGLSKRFMKNVDMYHPPLMQYQKQMESIIKSLNNSVVNNNQRQMVSIGDIHITCPGVTSQEVAKQVGVELNNMFNGLHLNALQQSMIR